MYSCTPKLGTQVRIRYVQPQAEQAAVALLMRAAQQISWQDGFLFAPIVQNQYEGNLFMKIRTLLPKQPMAPVHMTCCSSR